MDEWLIAKLERLTAERVYTGTLWAKSDAPAGALIPLLSTQETDPMVFVGWGKDPVAPARQAYARYVAAAVSTLPDLLAEIRALQAAQHEEAPPEHGPPSSLTRTIGHPLVAYPVIGGLLGSSFGMNGLVVGGVCGLVMGLVTSGREKQRG